MTQVLEVWRIDLDRCAASLLAHDAATPCVAADDRARVTRLEEPVHRRERLAAHVALRLVLQRHGADDGKARAYERLPSGKPVLAGHWRAEDALAPGGLDFSLSHIDRLALVAISRNTAVGIDVERLRPVAMDGDRRDVIERAAARLAPDSPLPPPGDVRRLQQAWTRLEALAKARGVGMARLLAEIGVVGPAWTARRDAAAGPPGDAVAPAMVGDSALVRVRDLDCANAELVAALARAGHLPHDPPLLPFPDDAIVPRR